MTSAALTDIFDGWIARKLGAVSDFGRLMDALVDKIFILGLLVALMAANCLPGRHVLPPVLGDLPAAGYLDPSEGERLLAAFGVVLILCREFLITGLRLVAAAEGDIEADREARDEMLTTICDTLSCAAVHHLGKMLILYRFLPKSRL